MKVLSLEIHNIGIISHEVIPFDKPLLLFYGDVMQGKTTILNSIKWLLGASIPSDIIKHGEDEGYITLNLDAGVITRSWYRSKADKSTKARELTFIQDGKPVKKPATHIAGLLNPFLLDQNYLLNMGEADRKRWFSETFAVDTSELDKEKIEKEREASNLRAEVAAFGDIDLAAVPDDNAADIKAKLDEARKKHNAGLVALNQQLTELHHDYSVERQKIDQENETARKQNASHEDFKSRRASAFREVGELEKKLEAAKALVADYDRLMKETPLLVLKPYPEKPSTAEIEAKIANFPSTSPEVQALEADLSKAEGNKVRREQLAKNQARARERDQKAARLHQLEQRIKEIRKEKVAKLAKISEDCKIKGLSFDEDGTFTYQGTQAGMLSTSQLMKLSSELSSLYPQGFGLELIDRGESLGKSIFDFVEKAKRESRTILATIVGDEPAETPEGIGVFVVEGGKVKPKSKGKQAELI